MSSYRDYRKTALKDPAVKEAYDALQPEYDRIQSMMDAQSEKGLAKKEQHGQTDGSAGRAEN